MAIGYSEAHVESSVKAYLTDISAHDLLTLDEERDLTTAYAASGRQDAALRERLMLGNLRLVVRLASRFQAHYV